LFTEGEIIYFIPFYFKNGNASKNKYFIVLKKVDENIILAALPTSVNKIPSFITANHGCINYDDGCFNCYFFEANRVICDNGFAPSLAQVCRVDKAAKDTCANKT
jgi:hypothetical protein